MRVFKVSFLMRSPSVNWEYKAANNRDLAEDLTAAMEKAVAPAKPVHRSKGSIQHHFYIGHFLFFIKFFLGFLNKCKYITHTKNS